MIKRIFLSIKNPANILFWLKDSYGKMIRHMMLMAMLLTLPFLIMALAAPERFYPETSDIYIIFDEKLEIKHAQFNENRLSFIPKDQIVSLDYYAIGTGTHTQTLYFRIEEDRFSFYMFGMKMKETSYESLNLGTLDFNNSTDLMLFSKSFQEFMSDQVVVTAIQVQVQFVLNLIDYLLIVIVMAVSMSLNARVPLTRRIRFSASTYLSSIYAVSALLLVLFGFSGQILPFILVVVYHVMFYKRIRVEIKEDHHE